MKKMGAHIWLVGLVIIILISWSCSKEQLDKTITTPMVEQAKVDKTSDTPGLKKDHTYKIENCGLRYTGIPALDDSCTLTDFAVILFGYINSLVSDPDYQPALTQYYAELNKKYAVHYRGDNYFGKDGEYDQLAKKRWRELNAFWDLKKEITLNAQHTISLDNRETLAAMIESFDPLVRNREEAYAKADALIAYNSSSPNYPENPFFALEAFTLRNGLLVIGDGLLQTLVETGIDEKVAFTAVISHEWWHQVHYEYEDKWNLELENQAARSRYLELEADFAAAYFMAHKRGATFNWKLIEQYFTLSFNVGDCFIQSNQHHGTPEQRYMAAKYGYKLADNSKKKGFILSPEQVHKEFLKLYPVLIAM
ncbi:hypothetical protein [Christiangramia aquimixticola]|uniref:hypothetical protein n=1 Tax=Christiangramia aquimixticola TaxID=1697558 RepID=UPI003AA7D0C4